MEKSETSILFLGKAEDAHTARALQFCQQNFTDVSEHVGAWGDPLPTNANVWEGDYIISYLSRWIVPEHCLRRARVAAINFHPAPPEYPGIGCTNFALYDSAGEYGVTCHHMEPRVDTGQIVAVRRFPLLRTDDVASLLLRTYDHQIVLFYEIMTAIIKGHPLPISPETWRRKPYTRKEFEELRRITADMSQEEIAKRSRAVCYKDWTPIFE